MINKRFLGKGGIVDYQTSNTAYDKLAFIADNYPDMVKMYDTIMAHLKLPSNEGGSGCNYLKHTYSGFPVVIKVGNVTKYGYDTSKPDDMEIIRNSLSISYEGFQITKPMYVEEFKERQQQTSFKNYGVKNPSKSKIILARIEKTMMERYGVEEIFSKLK